MSWSRTFRRQLRAWSRSTSRSASTSGGTCHPGRGCTGRYDRAQRRPCARVDHDRVLQRPVDQDPVALVEPVDAVAHHAVEVGEVLRDLRPELAQVEVGVACDQRVVGPLDQGDAPVQAPRPLVQLERESHVAARHGGCHPGDVAVHRAGGRGGVEAHADADHRVCRRTPPRHSSRPSPGHAAAPRSSAACRALPRSRPGRPTASCSSARLGELTDDDSRADRRSLVGQPGLSRHRVPRPAGRPAGHRAAPCDRGGGPRGRARRRRGPPRRPRPGRPAWRRRLRR